MQKEYRKWRSPSLGKDMQLLIFGDSGAPVIVFPSETGSYTEWEENGVIDALSEQIHLGYNQLFCVDSVYHRGLLNENLKPEKRLTCQIQYECYIIEEVIPFIKEQNEHFFMMTAGVGLGAWEAILLALKHPEDFDKVIGVSGEFDIRKYLNDHYNETAYYNNPVDFVPNLNEPKILNQLGNLDLRLVSYDNDPHRESTERMSRTLWMKMLDHRLDIWSVEPSDLWKLWGEMIKTHII